MGSLTPFFFKLIFSVGLFITSQASLAANLVYLSPSNQVVDLSDGMTSVELWMDFDDPTVGGGIDLTLSGPIAWLGFTPSEFFLNEAEDDFSGHSGPAPGGTADNDYEIHFGAFTGLQGQNLLGTIDLALLNTGNGAISLDINNTWGEFFSAADFNALDVTLDGATVEITAVPVPAALWLFMSGLGLLGFTSRQSK